MINNLKLFNKISSAINASFGSNGPEEAADSMKSVKFELVDEKTLKAKYVSIITFTNVERLNTTMKKYENEAIEVIKAALKQAQENFSKLELDGVDKKTIKFETDTKDSISNVDYINVFSPTKRAFFKYSCIVKVK